MESGRQYWVHDLNPVIVQFTETLAIRWYGLDYVAGFLIAFGLFHLARKKGRSPLAPAMLESFSINLILGVVLGGRLGYFLLYDFNAFIGDPLVFLRVWEGGMASHGGFAGVALAVYLTGRKYGIPVLQIGDLVASTAAAGLFLGRIANFINGQLWGKVSEVPWAVIFPKSAAPGMPVQLIAPRHPSQLYEAILEGLLLFIYMQWRFWKVPNRVRPSEPGTPASARPGHLCGEFLLLYAVGRMIAEQFREPDAALILGLSRGSFYSVFLVMAGIFLVVFSRRRQLTNGQIT